MQFPTCLNYSMATNWKPARDPVLHVFANNPHHVDISTINPSQFTYKATQLTFGQQLVPCSFLPPAAWLPLAGVRFLYDFHRLSLEEVSPLVAGKMHSLHLANDIVMATTSYCHVGQVGESNNQIGMLSSFRGGTRSSSISYVYYVCIIYIYNTYVFEQMKTRSVQITSQVQGGLTYVHFQKLSEALWKWGTVPLASRGRWQQACPEQRHVQIKGSRCASNHPVHSP